MGTRIQEIARLRTMEFLIEQAMAIGASHRALAGQLNDVLATLRKSLSDLPADDDNVV